MEIKLYEALSPAEIDRLHEVGAADGALALTAFDIPRETFGLSRFGADRFAYFAKKVEVFGAVYLSRDVWRTTPAGFFYLTDIERSTAYIHFCLFKAGQTDRLDIGRLALRFCFQSFGLRCLIGLIPVINLGARKFAGEIGGREVCRVSEACWMERLKRNMDGALYLFTPAKGE